MHILMSVFNILKCSSRVQRIQVKHSQVSQLLLIGFMSRPCTSFVPFSGHTPLSCWLSTVWTCSCFWTLHLSGKVAGSRAEGLSIFGNRSWKVEQEDIICRLYGMAADCFGFHIALNYFNNFQ